ncbi:MAG TPA: DUF305 domain-containing protein [Gemmatimonadaceae bacterium]|nr:DUF305 domain-containing protein [Gemmatimonadaceae bacterium]
MTPVRIRGISAVMLAAMAGAACSSATRGAAQHASQPAAVADESEQAAIAQARTDSIRRPYTEADIRFMTGMIPHHSQAIVMSGWAPSHGANPDVQRLAARIINAQRDEIVTMQSWLRDRRQPVPPASAAGMPMMAMDGSQHTMLMPGMLTPEQMKQLDAARGADFDRLFLTFMIQHHSGAISMVKDLFASYGAGQDELVFKLASEINVDQSTEIARMRKMLVFLALGGGSQ